MAESQGIIIIITWCIIDYAVCNKIAKVLDVMKCKHMHGHEQRI